MQTYEITLTGTQPLLVHNDDIDWADVMTAWKDDPKNKKESKAGDDRTPAHRWIGNLYHDGNVVVLPTANIMIAIREGGALVPVPGAKGGKTFKAQSQSGILPNALGWPLLINGRPIPYAPIAELISVKEFETHKATAEHLGFTLFCKRARVNATKHIRVRPRFENWSAAGVLLVVDDQITRQVLTDILSYAGQFKGLGDWRPSSPKSPGSFGTFRAEVKPV